MVSNNDPRLLGEPSPELGSEILAANNYQRDGRHLPDMHVVAYLEQQRERVRRFGQCSAGCDCTDIIPHYATGRDVCPHTLQPCTARQLSPILATYGPING